MDNFWIDLTQKILKIRKTPLRHRSFLILTTLRNIIERFPISRSDKDFLKKTHHRINTAINIFTEILLNFQKEMSFWEVIPTFKCPKSEWVINYDEKTLKYKFFYSDSCIEICQNRETILNKLTKKFEVECFGSKDRNYRR